MQKKDITQLKAFIRNQVLKEFANMGRDEGPSKREFTIDDLKELEKTFFLDIQEDNEGQMVIYTGLYSSQE